MPDLNAVLQDLVKRMTANIRFRDEADRYAFPNLLLRAKEAQLALRKSSSHDIMAGYRETIRSFCDRYGVTDSEVNGFTSRYDRVSSEVQAEFAQWLKEEFAPRAKPGTPSSHAA